MAEVVPVAKEDINLDLADWRAGKAGNYAVEDGPTWLKLLGLDAQPLHGLAVQDVDVVASIYQDPSEVASPPLHGEGGL